MERGEKVFFSKEAVSSVPWLLVGKILTFILYFLLSVVIVRGLGSEQYGVYALLTSLAESLMVVGALGLNTSLLRFIPELVTQQRRKGLLRLLGFSGGLQLLALAFIGAVLFGAHRFLSIWLHLPFLSYAPFVLLLLSMLLAKEFINNTLTALFRARFLAITSVGQSLLFIFGLAWLRFLGGFTAEDVLAVYALSIAVMLLVCLGGLYHFFIQWKQLKDSKGVETRRLLSLSLPTMFNALTNKLLQQYSEVFFLGFFVAPALVGYYSLGFLLANLLLTFIPMALHTLFTSAFAEAFTRDRHVLGDLIQGVYQVLIAFTMPLACFGFFFAPSAVSIIYGAEMAPAGYVAAFFCLFQLLPMVWIPLSMALTATEQVRKTMWLNVLQLCVNLPLDYWLIREFGLSGALAAISITYFLTAPIKLAYIHRLLGGIYFPFSFFFRVGGAAFILAAGLYLVIPTVHPTFVFLGVPLYVLLFIATLRVAKLVHHQDVKRFREMHVPILNKLFDYLTGSYHRTIAERKVTREQGPNLNHHVPQRLLVRQGWKRRTAKKQPGFYVPSEILKQVAQRFKH